MNTWVFPTWWISPDSAIFWIIARSYSIQPTSTDFSHFSSVHFGKNNNIKKTYYWMSITDITNQPKIAWEQGIMIWFLVLVSLASEATENLCFFRLFDVDGQGFIRGDTFRVRKTKHIQRLLFQLCSLLAYFKVPSNTLHWRFWYLGFCNISDISI